MAVAASALRRHRRLRRADVADISRVSSGSRAHTRGSVSTSTPWSTGRPMRSGSRARSSWRSPTSWAPLRGTLSAPAECPRSAARPRTLADPTRSSGCATVQRSAERLPPTRHTPAAGVGCTRPPVPRRGRMTSPAAEWSAPKRWRSRNWRAVPRWLWDGESLPVPIESHRREPLRHARRGPRLAGRVRDRRQTRMSAACSLAGGARILVDALEAARAPGPQALHHRPRVRSPGVGR